MANAFTVILTLSMDEEFVGHPDVIKQELVEQIKAAVSHYGWTAGFKVNRHTVNGKTLKANVSVTAPIFHTVE